jgi:3-hydroxyacyl-CoA dehydrogenase/enoyl-CoA hydratase/3-hydroxybutyryl-CoA epimerase
MPYMTEAFYLLTHGISASRIDRIMKKFGMAMGPFELADFVGLDILSKVSKIFENKLGKTAKAPEIVNLMAQNPDVLGKKTGMGFYNYNNSKQRKNINYNLINSINQYRQQFNIAIWDLSDRTIEQMIIYRMINEAYKCMEEKLITDHNYIDLAMIYGSGFPPFRGGIFRYCCEIGESNIYIQLKNFEEKYGERYQPSAWFEKENKMTKICVSEFTNDDSKLN